MKRIKRSQLLLAFLTGFLFFAALPVLASEGGVTSSTELELQITSIPEARLCFIQGFTFPFLRGSGPMTRGNNINTLFTLELTPLSVNGIGEITLTPAAFFLLHGGGRAGSGWDIPIGYGMGINRPVDTADGNAGRPRQAVIDGGSFDGLVWSAWGAGTVQFDLGAVLPGDWNHVLFQTRQEMRYSAFTRAAPGESWLFENDHGENKNGWMYFARYVIGYSMPRSPVLNMIAFMAELEKFLYNTPGGDFWGEDLGRWVFSGLLEFTITPRFNATFGVQMETHRNHGTSNFGNRGYFYQDFPLITEGGSRRLLFYRAALILNYSLR